MRILPIVGRYTIDDCASMASGFDSQNQKPLLQARTPKCGSQPELCTSIVCVQDGIRLGFGVYTSTYTTRNNLLFRIRELNAVYCELMEWSVKFYATSSLPTLRIRGLLLFDWGLVYGCANFYLQGLVLRRYAKKGRKRKDHNNAAQTLLQSYTVELWALKF